LTGLLKDASQDILEGTEVLHVLYPDIVKEYMFLYYFEEEDIREVSGLLWRNCPAEYNAFLSRCLTDSAGGVPGSGHQGGFCGLYEC
jgi:hypothetical protein